MKNTRLWRKISYWKKVFCRQEIYFPRQIKCKYDWIGSQYGGFYVVRNLLNKDSIVYSFGVGDDISFDLALIEQYGLNVYAFDPTPLAIKFVEENVINQSINQSIHSLNTSILRRSVSVKKMKSQNFIFQQMKEILVVRL